MAMPVKNLSYVGYSTLLEGFQQSFVDECSATLAGVVSWGDAEFTIISAMTLHNACFPSGPKNDDEALLHARLTHLIEQGIHVDMES